MFIMLVQPEPEFLLLTPASLADKLGFPASNRDFTFLILTKETTPTEGGPRSFVVISIPYDAPHEKGWVRARYVSFEEVKETPEGLIWS